MRSINRRDRGIAKSSVVALLGFAAVAGVGTFSIGDSGDRHFEPVTGSWILPGIVYMGDASCSSAACHGSDEAKMQSGQMIGDESTIFAASGADGDPHYKAWKTLRSADSKAMAGKLGIGDAVTSDRCLSCHALDVPAPQRGDKFNIETGNSCETCHGPSERWLQPHAKAGWTQEQRAAVGTMGFIKTHGLLDTSDMALRAEMCVSCHLQIDKDLLDAGHPPLQFEMYGYNNYFFNKQYTPHWDEPEGKMIMAKQWAVGQAAALDASSRQSQAWKGKGWETAAADALTDMYRSGVGIAKKHFGAESTSGLSRATYSSDKCAAAAKDLAALAGVAKTTMERKIIAFGVMALAEASFDGRGAEAPDALWDAFDEASKGAEGASYVDAVKKMADLAK